jgi:glycosyltransferase involved in cell wall biosynthesis
MTSEQQITTTQAQERRFRKNPELKYPAVLPQEIQNEFKLPKGNQERITFIVPFRGEDRISHLKRCISNLQLRYPVSEILVIEDDITPSIKTALPGARYVYVFNKRRFNKAKCFNLGCLIATNPVICGVDCDMIIPSTVLSLNHASVVSHKVVFPGRDIYYADKDTNPFKLDEPLWWHKTWLKDMATWQFHGGLFICTKQAFARCGGFDQRFEGYGSEDTNFYMRCDDSRNAAHTRNVTLIHIEHGYSPAEHEAMETNKRLLIIYSRIEINDRISECKKNNIFAVL